MWTILIRSFFHLLDIPITVFDQSLNGAQNLKFPGFSDWLFRFLQTPRDWLSYVHFCGYKAEILPILRIEINIKKKNFPLSPLSIEI